MKYFHRRQSLEFWFIIIGNQQHKGEKMKNDIFLYYQLIKDLFSGKLDEWFIV
jgi:hypothetical protein